jgi:hypothetical protein
MAGESDPPVDDAPPVGPVTIPPEDSPEQVQLGLTDILEHLTMNAQAQIAARPAALGAAGAAGPEPEVTARLANVARLSAELNAELAALDALRPAEPR